jgi:hypothetical protein
MKLRKALILFVLGILAYFVFSILAIWLKPLFQ